MADPESAVNSDCRKKIMIKMYVHEKVEMTDSTKIFHSFVDARIGFRTSISEGKFTNVKVMYESKRSTEAN